MTGNLSNNKFYANKKKHNNEQASIFKSNLSQKTLMCEGEDKTGFM